MFIKKIYQNLEEYLPNFKDTIKLKDHKILFDYKNNNFNVKGKGNISIENDVDFLNINFQKLIIIIIIILIPV